MSEPKNNETETVAGTNNVYTDPPIEPTIYDEDPGHLREAPWQAHLDARYGVLTREFTNARSAAETARATIKNLFDHKADGSHSALLSMPTSIPKTAAPATLSEQVKKLCGRR